MGTGLLPLCFLARPPLKADPRSPPPPPTTASGPWQVYRQLGRTEDAARCFVAAVQAQPAFAEAYAGLAEVGPWRVDDGRGGAEERWGREVPRPFLKLPCGWHPLSF